MYFINPRLEKSLDLYECHNIGLWMAQHFKEKQIEFLSTLNFLKASGAIRPLVFHGDSHLLRGLSGPLFGEEQVPGQRDAPGVPLPCHLSGLSEGRRSLHEQKQFRPCRMASASWFCFTPKLLLVTLYNKVRKTWVVTEERMSNEWWTTRALTGP